MKSFKGRAWFVPQSVIVIGTYDADDIPNAMNAAWSGQWDNDEIMISQWVTIRQRLTLTGIRTSLLPSPRQIPWSHLIMSVS